MEDFSKDAVIVTALKGRRQAVTLVGELARMGFALILLTDSGSCGEAAQLPGVAILRDRHGRKEAPGFRDALEYLHLHCPELEHVAVLKPCAASQAEEAAGLLSAVHGRKRLMAVENRRPGKDVSFRDWRRNRLSSLLPRLISGEGKTDSHLGSRAFSAQLIPQFLAVEGEGQAYDRNCLLACIGTGIALEEVSFPLKKRLCRPLSFFHSVSPE